VSIPAFRPTIKRRDMDSVLSCMISDRIGPGSLALQLASELAGYLGLAGGGCCADYPAAVGLALDMVDVARGDRVLVSALSPSLYLDVLRRRGAEPVVADVDPDSGTLRAEEAEKCMTAAPKAILLHYTLGFIPDLEALTALGVPVIEDLSQGLGGNLGTRRCGTYGDICVLSLEPECIVTCAHGGAVLARDRRRVRELRDQPAARGSRLSNMNASLGLAQMRQIEGFIATRKEIAQAYTRALLQSSHKPLVQKGEADNTYYSFPVLLEKNIREVKHYARRKDVDIALAFEDSVVSALEESNGRYPNARLMSMRCVLFPLYPMLGKRNVEYVSKVLSTLP